MRNLQFKPNDRIDYGQRQDDRHIDWDVSTCVVDDESKDDCEDFQYGDDRYLGCRYIALFGGGLGRERNTIIGIVEYLFEPAFRAGFWARTGVYLRRVLGVVLRT